MSDVPDEVVEWCRAFAGAAGVEPPTEQEVDDLLALAGVAAHASAAPSGAHHVLVGGSRRDDVRARRLRPLKRSPTGGCHEACHIRPRALAPTSGSSTATRSPMSPPSTAGSGLTSAPCSPRACSTRSPARWTVRPVIALARCRARVAPVLRPPKFLAIGLNYATHVAESGMDAPAHQLWFNKQSTCVIGPGAPIHMPQASSVVDYEGELAFVIGRRCRHVPAERAAEVIAGYTICNDVSVRDWQIAHTNDDDGQVVRHARPARPVGRHPRRAGRPPPPVAAHVGERRASPRRQDRRPHLRLLRHGRAPLDRVHARAGRCHLHWYAGGRRHRDEAAAACCRQATSFASRSRASAPSRTP